jgi:cell division initiation protein
VRLTPLEVRKQNFSRRRLGGISSEEVQDFLNLIASELEDILRENAALKDQRVDAERKLDEFQTMEETLRKTLVRAEKIGSESKEHAQREAELILQQAHLRAERVLSDARTRLRQLTDEIEELHKKKEVFVHRFRSLVNMQLELLDQHGPDYEDISRLAEDANQAIDRYTRHDEQRGEPRGEPRGEEPRGGATRRPDPAGREPESLGELSDPGRGHGRETAPVAEGLLGLGRDED